MFKGVLEGALTAEQHQAGLYLEEDEDFLYLKRGDQVLALFSAVGATVASVREAAVSYIAEMERR